MIKELAFKPAIESQRELIHRWLKQDYVRAWIHGQGLQNTLMGLENFFQSQSNNIDSSSDITQHWIGYDGSKPFVYLLTSNVPMDAENEYAKYSETKGPAITLDISSAICNILGKVCLILLFDNFC